MDIKADHLAVGAMGAGLRAVVDIKVDRRAAATVAAIPEVARVGVRRVEALSLQAAMLHRDIMAADSSRPGAKPASAHRSPSGGSQGSLLLSLRIGMERKNLCGEGVSYKRSVLF